MALTPHEMTRLRNACDQLNDGPDYRCENYVDNLLNTALDFYMKSKTADAAICYFKRTHGAKNHQNVKALIAKYPNTKEGNQSLAKCFWNNNHWSRAKFLRKIVQFLEERKVADQQSLDRWANSAVFETDVKGQLKTDEHSIGYTLFQWLRVRCGANTVKPDVRVINFATDAVGRKVTPVEAVVSLETVAKDSNRRANRLDSAIWHFMESSVSSPLRFGRLASLYETSRVSNFGKRKESTMGRPVIEPAHIDAVVAKFADKRFDSLEFANEFKASFPEDWETLVSKYGRGGSGNGSFYSPYNYLGQRLKTRVRFETWVNAPDRWGSRVIAQWKN